MKSLKIGEVSLRHFKESDAKPYFESFDEWAKKCMFFVPKNKQETKKKIREYLKEYKIPASKRKIDAFVIEFKGEFAGFMIARKIIYKHQARTTSLIKKEFRGKGIATKAHKILNPYIFKKYKLKRMDAGVRTYNKASVKMLEKSGYQLEGCLRKIICVDGKYYDNYIYSIIK